jgi:hypothetical protein
MKKQTKQPNKQPIVSVDLIEMARRSEDIPNTVTDDDLKDAFSRYERFLLLIQRYPKHQLAPTGDIDMMWHLHMLSPRAYHRDCLRLFGDVLDHNGGFGAEVGELVQLANAFEETAKLWQKEFRVPFADMNKPRQRFIHCKPQPW